MNREAEVPLHALFTDRLSSAARGSVGGSGCASISAVVAAGAPESANLPLFFAMQQDTCTHAVEDPRDRRKLLVVKSNSERMTSTRNRFQRRWLYQRLCASHRTFLVPNSARLVPFFRLRFAADEHHGDLELTGTDPFLQIRGKS